MLLMCDPSYSLKFCFTPPTHPPTPGGGVTHVALFMHTVFHINLFLRYKRADITKTPLFPTDLYHVPPVELVLYPENNKIISI